MKHPSYEDEFDRVLGRRDKKNGTFVRYERHRAKTVYKRGDMVKVPGIHLATLINDPDEPVFMRRLTWNPEKLILIAASDSDEAVVWEDEEKYRYNIPSQTWKFPITMWPFLYGVDVVWFVASYTSNPSEAMRTLYGTYFTSVK